MRKGCERVEKKTNGQGAGHTAGAGRERRQSDVINVGMVVGEKGGFVQQEEEESRMRKWKKGRI